MYKQFIFSSTFHYGSIKILNIPPISILGIISTFHYGSIKMKIQWNLYLFENNLHSTMVLLKSVQVV